MVPDTTMGSNPGWEMLPVVSRSTTKSAFSDLGM
jgi:hypothetical protein